MRGELEEIDFVDVNAVPQAKAPRKTDALCRSCGELIGKSAREDARLRRHGHSARRPDRKRHETPHQRVRRADEADRIGTNRAHPGQSQERGNLGLTCAAFLADFGKSGRHDRHGLYPATCAVPQSRHDVRRRNDEECEIDAPGHVRNRGVGPGSKHALRSRVDWIQVAPVSALEQVAIEEVAGFASCRRGTNDRYRPWRKEGAEGDLCHPRFLCASTAIASTATPPRGVITIGLISISRMTSEKRYISRDRSSSARTMLFVSTAAAPR